jgi:hypothetical protein
MGYIDVAIPLAGALFMLFCPLRSTGSPEKDAANKRFFRIIGTVLLVVAGLFLIAKLGSSGTNPSGVRATERRR